MSIIFRSIELSNIRSHKHFVFEPSENGITVISGPNGAGKSSIIDAISWTLYGVKPAGVSKSSAMLRNGADLKNEKCYAVVELEVDGAAIKIERRIVSKAGAVECDVYEWDNDAADWTHKAGAAVSHAEEHIRQRLGMDQAGFLAAVLVPQKQVDQLISASPKDRAKVIEKLTGISALAVALSSARQEHNELKKVLSYTNVDSEAVVNTEKELVEKNKTLISARSEAKEINAELSAVTEEREKLQEEYSAASSSSNQFTAKKNRKIELSALVKSKTAEFERAVEARKKAKKNVPTESGGLDLQKLEEKLSQAEKVLQTTKSAIATNEERTRSIRERATAAKQRLEEYGVEPSEVSEKLSKTTERVQAGEKKLTDCEATVVDLESRITQLESAAEVVGHGECPTCLQTVPEASDAVSALRATISELQTRADSERKLTKRVRKLLAEVREECKKLQGLVEDAETIEEAKDSIANLNTESQALLDDLKVQEADVRVARNLHSKAERSEELKSAYKEAHEYAQSVSGELSAMNDEVATLEEEMKEYSVISDKALEKLREKTEKQNEKFYAVQRKMDTIVSSGKLLKVEIEQMERDLDRMRIEEKKHKEAVAAVEVASSAVHIVDEFRNERTRTALPAIESYASEFVRRFTDNAFTNLKLDSKFNATVMLPDGSERAVGMLSGGELSVVALSLRLAISILLHGSGTNTAIILDEVLVSQDADRSERILSTIKDVHQGQIVLIAHNENIDAIADKTVELPAP